MHPSFFVVANFPFSGEHSSIACVHTVGANVWYVPSPVRQNLACGGDCSFVRVYRVVRVRFKYDVMSGLTWCGSKLGFKFVLVRFVLLDALV